MRPKQHSIIGYSITCLVAVALSTLISYVCFTKKDVKHSLPTPTPSFERQIESFVTQNPSFLLTAMRQSLEEEKKVQEIKQKTAIRTHAHDLYDFKDYPFIGNPEGDIKIVSFSDYQCGYCKTFSSELSGLVALDPRVMVIFRDLPLFGPLSMKLALMALATQEQGKYAEFHNALMKETTPLTLSRAFEIATSLDLDMEKLKSSMNDPLLKKKIANTQSLAQTIDIHQTQSFVLNIMRSLQGFTSKMLSELMEGLIREQRRGFLFFPTTSEETFHPIPHPTWLHPRAQL